MFLSVGTARFREPALPAPVLGILHIAFKREVMCNVVLGTPVLAVYTTVVVSFDSTFITDRPTQLLKQKKVNGVSQNLSIRALHTECLQEIFYSANSNEDSIFVNPSTKETLQYIQAAEAEAQYAGLRSNFAEAISIVGECKSDDFISHSNDSDNFFRDIRLPYLLAARESEFAIPPPAHGDDINYYFPKPSVYGSQLRPGIKESFTNFAIFLNPKIKWESNITPSWSLWSGSNEMLFNKTEADIPDIRSTETSKALLKRCRRALVRQLLNRVDYAYRSGLPLEINYLSAHMDFGQILELEMKQEVKQQLVETMDVIECLQKITDASSSALQ
ncbi:hypothetical protein CVT25_002650 [Psilocybe cyanescens]|uniref:Carboxylesterase type B domain-containing protein n=1 Tax=Psilocybe cyanescens TaxID=93625 RepID=A0A409WLT5_PSICY|nr:hypothetical protein CVT25_002650 [Psilocybe cyanescens]